VDQTLAALNLLGVIVFAISGALAAAQRRMDPFGLVVLATVTGLGGGTLRDLFLGIRPVDWVNRPDLVITCAATGTGVYIIVPHLRMTRLTAYTRALNWADAVGLALFAVTGTQRALDLDAPPVTAIALGMLTAIGGGIIRDLLAGTPPLILHREIYALAALLGGFSFWALQRAGLDTTLALVLATLAAFGLRVLGFTRGWSLPAYGGNQ
jgi:uncharacterized membrane protein YeiH